jgi:hypothetical protein
MQQRVLLGQITGKWHVIYERGSQHTRGGHDWRFRLVPDVEMSLASIHSALETDTCAH